MDEASSNDDRKATLRQDIFLTGFSIGQAKAVFSALYEAAAAGYRDRGRGLLLVVYQTQTEDTRVYVPIEAVPLQFGEQVADMVRGYDPGRQFVMGYLSGCHAEVGLMDVGDME